LCVLVWAPIVLSQTALRAEELPPTGEATSQSGWLASLWMTEEYRFRNAGTAGPTSTVLGETGLGSVRDQDLRLSFDGSLTGLGGHFAATLSSALWIDLDGQNAQDTQDVFGESRGVDRLLGVTYVASAEWRRVGALSRLAIGRQQANHGLPVTFDGGAFDVQFLNRWLTFFGFGGRTVHFFEILPGFFENWLVSGGAGLRLGQNIKLEADSRYLHEMVLGSGGVLRDRVNTNSYGATVMAYSEQLQGRVFARGINHSLAHIGGNLHLQIPHAGLGIDAQAASQLVTLGEIAESENPYYSMLGTSLPYLRGRIEVWKEFDLGSEGTVLVAVGTRLRQLLYDQSTRFNRNMNASYVRADLNDQPFKGAFASVSGEWNMPTQPGDSARFFTVGGSAGYSSGTTRLEAGSYFQRFKINYYRDVEELEDARTFYAAGSCRVFAHLELRARYLAEIVDRTIQSVYLTLREDL
jgi:hypothetical protein